MIRQLSDDGWECHVAVPTRAWLADEYAAAGATLHIVPMRHLTTSGSRARWVWFALRWPVSVLRLAGLGRRLRVDVVHSNSLHSWYGWAAAALLRRAHVWHAREIVFQSAAALRVERALCRRFAVAVVAVSEAVAAQLDAANVTVISDEADPERFGPARAGALRASLGIGDSVPLAGSMARLDTWKGFDTLLDGFEVVRADRPDAELVIAGAVVPGKEGYAAGVERRAAAMDGVHWLGHRSDAGELMADLDVFVQVSTEPEPFGLVVVEALASGVPVVAGAEGGPLEILGQKSVGVIGPAGTLVTPGDAGALAGAVLALLPAPGALSSTAARRARRPLRTPTVGAFSALFDGVVGVVGVVGGRRRRRRRRRGRLAAG